MIKFGTCIVLGALLGGLASKYFVERTEEQHRHTRSVMTLLFFHQDRMEKAGRADHCADFAAEHARLVTLQPEIALAFPQAYQQEADFRKKADGLATALQSVAFGDATPSTCPDAFKRADHVADACDACHKVYDPQ